MSPKYKELRQKKYDRFRFFKKWNNLNCSETVVKHSTKLSEKSGNSVKRINIKKTVAEQRFQRK